MGGGDFLQIVLNIMPSVKLLFYSISAENN